MCDYCEKSLPLVIGKTNDVGIAFRYPNKLIAYGYDVHGSGTNGLIVDINFCPMCGKEVYNEDLTKVSLRYKHRIRFWQNVTKRYLGVRSPGGIAARACTSCRKYKTMECPNSAECYSTIHKPHFEAW